MLAAKVARGWIDSHHLGDIRVQAPTRHTYDGRCKRLVHDAINVLVFVVLDVCTGL